jgi:hypothetical protein
MYRVTIALGEHAELETVALLAARRGFISTTAMEEFTPLATQVGELAHGLLRALEALEAASNEPTNPDPSNPRPVANPKSRTPNPR